MFYSLASSQVGALWRAMRDIAVEHVAQLDELADAYLGDRAQLATIGRDELAARLRTGDVVVLDVRPPAEYDAGTSPAPSTCYRLSSSSGCGTCRRTSRRRLLPRPFCVYADDAVRALSSTGRSALRLVDGFPEWAAAALPTSRTG